PAVSPGFRFAPLVDWISIGLLDAPAVALGLPEDHPVGLPFVLPGSRSDDVNLVGVDKPA
ncbi:MAG: hypothetical protein JSV18_03315, partial [Candidatus Bathyarchaeota archaeon]